MIEFCELKRKMRQERQFQIKQQTPMPHIYPKEVKNITVTKYIYQQIKTV